MAPRGASRSIPKPMIRITITSLPSIQAATPMQRRWALSRPALILLQARLTSGSLITLRNNVTKEEQECVVAFLGPVRGNKAEIGLEFSARRPQFWRVAFPPEDWTPKSPEARTANQPRPNPK